MRRPGSSPVLGHSALRRRHINDWRIVAPDRQARLSRLDRVAARDRSRRRLRRGGATHAAARGSERGIVPERSRLPTRRVLAHRQAVCRSAAGGRVQPRPWREALPPRGGPPPRQRTSCKAWSSRSSPFREPVGSSRCAGDAPEPQGSASFDVDLATSRSRVGCGRRPKPLVREAAPPLVGARPFGSRDGA
jgi:hypothetical protein